MFTPAVNQTAPTHPLTKVHANAITPCQLFPAFLRLYFAHKHLHLEHMQINSRPPLPLPPPPPVHKPGPRRRYSCRANTFLFFTICPRARKRQSVTGPLPSQIHATQTARSTYHKRQRDQDPDDDDDGAQRERAARRRRVHHGPRPVSRPRGKAEQGLLRSPRSATWRCRGQANNGAAGIGQQGRGP